MFTGDKVAGIADSIAKVLPEAAYQRCTVHFYRNVLAKVPKSKREDYAETLAYTRFPSAHWRRIRTNNAIERINREISRRTRLVGTLPNGKGELMLVTARLEYTAESEWGSSRYLNVTLLDKEPHREVGL